jgi:hypothetical protein
MILAGVIDGTHRTFVFRINGRIVPCWYQLGLFFRAVLRLLINNTISTLELGTYSFR